MTISAYNNVQVQTDNVLDSKNQALMIAQTQLDGGCIHHTVRTIKLVCKDFDMICERIGSWQTRDGRLRDFHITQEKITDS